MEILVTIIAFWLILVGLYGAFSLTQDRKQERAPRVRTERPITLGNFATASGPFAPVSLPSETVPSFITRAAAPMRVEPMPPARVAVVEAADEPAEAEAASDDEPPARFRAEKVIAARLQSARIAEVAPPLPARPVLHTVRDEEPSYDEPRYQQARFEAPHRPQDTEVDFLRAQVEHLRSEINALSTGKPRRTDRPQQRRYRTGNYTHLPRTLRRQVNEVRGFRRFFSSN